MHYGPEVVIANELSYINETLREMLNHIERGKNDTVNHEILQALKDVTEYAAVNTCVHEETYRGGTIWEICSQCGMKWADDEGGKPDDAHELPGPIRKAYDILDKYGR